MFDPKGGLLAAPLALNLSFEGQGDLFYISWSPAQSKFYLSHKGNKLPEAWNFTGGMLSDSKTNIKTMFQTKAWWQKPSFPSEGLWVYLGRSTCHGVTLEGPAFFGHGKRILGAVSLGPASLQSSILALSESSEGASITNIWDPRPMGVAFIRQVFSLDDDDRNIIECREFSMFEGSLLIYLRMAYPDAYFELKELPQDKSYLVYWKRLCQNLGVRCGKASRWVDREAVPLDAKRLSSDFFPADLSHLSSVQAAIPETLVKLWSCS
ncbi:hypothetical protein [Pseudobacteriovorax antillogorgiicola]|uniref:Uncharacterized protein n=1 Tax=Pseudobacteriovorax antillogorgiicola TaxID=1513793 RepID=A0A1Y6B9B6_9BACT|nr:hypothetical protein [Pseudobacteriovorax antillogorgiicola]TCS58722.1 hypothetical protein EDD56_102235 [Pseudobacteriovorax antillogorgiicola]SME95367.1 hypothetical protein SAMN06296036_102208 [Pseudobacteriovorax antillogorgiicola]